MKEKKEEKNKKQENSECPVSNNNANWKTIMGWKIK